MPHTDRTHQLRELVSKSGPSGSKRKSTRGVKQENAKGSTPSDALLEKEYLREAYAILKHINDLARMLASIKRAYLNVDVGPSSFTHQTSRNVSLDSSEQWSNIRSLSNEERDQIDLQSRIILSKCSDRIQELEEIDRKRIEAASADKKGVMRFLPARLQNDSLTTYMSNLAAHHSSITYFLSRRLAELSQVQKEMQEERIKRQTERTKTLGSGAAREAADLRTHEFLSIQSSESRAGPSKSWLGEAASSLASTIGVSSPVVSSFSPKPDDHTFTQARFDDFDDDDDDDDDLELSNSQIQQFESENATILRSMQDNLASVQQAESRLMDISALQMELVAHLTKQNEISDQLYEDAIATTAMVERGNTQLKEAKRRAKDGRLYILVFLIGASFALLFLHYY